MTSADTLRRAAALMRERAQGTSRVMEDPGLLEALPGNLMPGLNLTKADAEHIASWGRDPALAVADLLDATADTLETDLAHRPAGLYVGDTPAATARALPALTVGRAYLREDTQP